MDRTLKKDLQASFRELIDMLDGLDEEQLNQISFEGSWTVAQVGDHLLQSHGIMQILNGKTIPTERKIDEKVSEIKNVFLTYGIEYQSLEFILPSEDRIDK